MMTMMIVTVFVHLTVELKEACFSFGFDRFGPSCSVLLCVPLFNLVSGITFVRIFLNEIEQMFNGFSQIVIVSL